MAVLSAEEVAKIRLLETENHALTQKLTSAMAIISDAAVAVEELQVTAANQEVPPFPGVVELCRKGFRWLGVL